MDMSNPAEAARTLSGSAAIPDARGINLFQADPMARRSRA